MILFTSATKRQIVVYFIISIICLLFGFVYELFSHNVYSIYMQFAFLIPLIFGFLATIIIHLCKQDDIMTSIHMKLYNLSVITFMVYSIVRGVLEIYGTTNYLINIYLMVGVFLLIISIFLRIFHILFHERA